MYSSPFRSIVSPEEPMKTHITLRGNTSDTSLEEQLLSAEIMEQIKRDQEFIWEEVKKATEHLDFYSFLCYWYELEIKRIWYFYVIYNDTVKARMRRQCECYAKSLSDLPSVDHLYYRFALQALYDSPTSTLRSVLKQMSLIRRYAFMHGVRLGKLAGEPPFSTREFQATTFVRKEILTRFFAHRSEVATKVPTT